MDRFVQETLLKIANQQNLPIPQELSILEERMQAPQDCSDLNEYLERFDFVLPISKVNLH